MVTIPCQLVALFCLSSDFLSFFHGSQRIISFALWPAAVEHLSPPRAAAEEHGDLFERSGLGLRGSRTASLLVRDGACR